LILVLSFLARPGAASAETPSGRFAPCGKEGPESAQCARLRVPENRQAAGRALDLFVVRIPAGSATPALDPVLYLAGGPGEAASETAAELPEILTALLPRRDLIFIDQRGTGRSRPLPCSGRGEPTPAEARACRKALERSADLRRYTTWDAAEDLEAVRRALGAPQVNLVGASYGTQVAQAYLRRYPDRVRTAMLIGALPLAPESLLFDGRDAQRALHLLFQDCASDPGCGAAFPKLEAETAEVLRRLEKKPVRVTVDDPEGGGPQEVLLDRQTFASTLRTRLYSATAQSRVPLALHQSYEGDYRSMARAAVIIARRRNRSASLGMFLSVFCSETAPFLDTAAVKRLAEGTFFGAERTLVWLQACREWPRGDIPADFAAPVKVDVPVLILSGRLDPVTPPTWGEQVAAFLPKSRQIIFAASSHFPDGPCASSLAARFIEQAGVAELEAQCAEMEVRPAFAVR
jgi:pimeloyl-ACP methyl ester carboxylesterase